MRREYSCLHYPGDRMVTFRVRFGEEPDVYEWQITVPTEESERIEDQLRGISYQREETSDDFPF